MQAVLKEHMHSSIEGFDIKRVGLFIQSKFTPLCGDWQWDMASTAVYCSDVMLAFPLQLEGTKGIIHPDDLPLVTEALGQLEYLKQVPLQFRIITTYGEIKSLTGKHIYVADIEPNETLYPEQEARDIILKQKQLAAELASLRQKQLAFEEAGKLAGCGIWYFNKATQDVYYSDQVFLFHGLPPQSLNAHINTFASFIHPQDRELVLEAIEKSFIQEIPLHLDYRIITANGLERYVRNIIQWSYTPNGERLLQGTIQDYTAYKEAEAYREQAEQQLWLQKQRLQFTESNSSTGFWQLNIITRKFTASDNFIRLHGLKPQSYTGGLSTFLNYVHPDDRTTVDNYYKTLQREHAANDIEYRIVRPDGKQRFLRQQGKTIIDDSGNMALFGLIQDITVTKTLEEKLKEKAESNQLNQYSLSIGESMVHTGTWSWNQESGEQYWSDGIYQLLGYKPQSVTITQQHLLKLIHPEYRKPFADALALTLQDEQDSSLEITLSRNGEPRKLKVAFKLFRYEEKRIFIGIFQDITKEQQLQKELSSRIELADLLTENLPDRVLLTDNENNILFWNKQCEKHYKLKRDQVLGKNFFDVFPHLQTVEKIQQFNTVLKGEAVHQQGTQVPLSKDIADLHMLPLHNEGKDIMGILHILHDVTEETTLRKNLTERLQFIQNLVEASVDRIVALDQNMNYTYWNKRAEEYYDIRKEKVLGKNILEVFPAFVNDPSFTEFRRALRGETVYIPANTTDNYGQYFATYLIPIKAENGEVTSVLWITHDLSKEVLLVRQQQKSNDILSMVNALFIEIDFDYRFKYINQKAEEYFHASQEALLGQVMWDVIPQAVGTAGYEAIKTACEERRKTETEYFSVVFNKWMFLSATPSPDGVLIFMYDRQDIKEIQQKLIESEALLRRSEQVVAIGSYEVDLATMTFHFSDGMFRLFGEEPQSFTPTLEFIDSRSHPDDTSKVTEVLNQAVINKQPYYYTRRIYRADGELRIVETHGKVICDEAGTAIKFIGLVQDITERQRAEAALQHHQRLINATLDNAYYMIQALRAIRNEEGRIVDFQWLLLNKTAEELFGPVTGEHVLTHLPGTEPSGLFDKLVQVTETGIRDQFEIYYEHDAVTGWYEMSVTKLEDGVVITSNNITERKKAETELQKSLTLLEQAEEVAGTGTWEYNIGSGNFYWSDGMYQMFGIESGQKVQPEQYLEKAIPEDLSKAQRIVDYLTHTYAPFEETLQIKANNQLKTIKCKGTVIYNDLGKPEKMLGIDVDITEMANAEDEIRKSQHFLQQVTDTAPDAITVFDLSQNEANYINPAVIESLLGYTAAELEAMGFEARLQNIIHPDDRETILTFNDKLRNAAIGDILTQEYRVRTKSGAIKWLVNRGKAFITNDPCHPRMLLSVLQDITQQKEAALELLESKQFIEEVMNATLDFIMVFDFRINQITYVNRQAYKEDEARYQETLRISYEQILERAHPGDREGLHQFIQGFKNLPDQEVRTFDFRETRGNEVLWYRSRGKVFKRDVNGEVVQYISVVQDISHERALYQQLTERTAFAEAVVESSVDAIIVLDKELCIKTWNRRCEQLYSIPSQKAINQRLIDILPQVAEDATLVNSFDRAMHGEFMYLPAKHNTYINRVCEYFFVPLMNERNEVYGVLNIIHDVSRQEEYSNALQEMNLLLQQQNVELEQRNEEIATFAFVASHDLKEPLRKIHTFSDWLLERENEQLSAKGQDFLKRLNLSVHRLNMLIDDILVLTKIHTDTRNDEDVNLNEVLKAVEEDLEELIVTTNTSIISEPLPTITSNRNQLFYLFRNLIHNAIKFQKPGNKPFIEISADVERHVNHPHAQPKREYLKVSIHDNGIGFNAKYARKMFKIFQQLHPRGEYEGTGMGLAICRKIMENNKGFITAESDEEIGSVFHCYFSLY